MDDRHVADLCDLYQGEWWSKGRTVEEVRIALQNSDVVLRLCRSDTGALVAFARVLTDRVFKAVLFDVIVAPAYRARGTGRLLMERVMAHPIVSRVRDVDLYCLPELIPFYRRWGFTAEVSWVNLMRRVRT
ncbi:MAG: GNAT family N-acetyltransferase [Nitrospira sp.]